MFFYTRDQFTCDYLNEITGYKKVKYSADTAFLSSAIRTNIPHASLLGANFRDIYFSKYSGDMDWKSWGVALNTIGVNKYIGDCSKEQFKLQLAYAYPAPHYDFHHTLGDILSSQIIFAMRYHVIIAAVINQVVPIPINYSPKVKRLAEQLGIEPLLLNCDEHHKAAKVFSLVESRHEEILRILSHNVELMTNRVRLMFREILVDLDKNLKIVK